MKDALTKAGVTKPAPRKVPSTKRESSKQHAARIDTEIKNLISHLKGTTSCQHASK